MVTLSYGTMFIIFASAVILFICGVKTGKEDVIADLQLLKMHLKISDPEELESTRNQIDLIIDFNRGKGANHDRS